MSMKFLCKGVIFMCLLTTMMVAPAFANAEEHLKKPAIVLVAFGTSVDTARPVFDHIDTQARKRYIEYDIHWAFTSQFIIDKLKRQGIVTQNVAEVVAELRKKGVKSVVFQSLHVVPGQEYNSVLKEDTSGFQVAFGDALMTSDKDIDAVVAASGKNIDAQQPTVVVAHGNDHHPEFNQQLVALTNVIEKKYPNLVVASVEGQPGIGSLEKVKVNSDKQGSVKFVPLMIVAGDHIMNDVMGDEEDSWKSIIQAKKSECAASLGWNNAILKIYFSHLDKALQQLDKGRN